MTQWAATSPAGFHIACRRAIVGAVRAVEEEEEEEL